LTSTALNVISDQNTRFEKTTQVMKIILMKRKFISIKCSEKQK